jgi:hypothetical protein
MPYGAGMHFIGLVTRLSLLASKMLVVKGRGARADDATRVMAG